MGDGQRILIFLPSFAGGGAERVLITVANGLRARGIDVHLFVANKSGPYRNEVDPRIRIVSAGERKVSLCLLQLASEIRRFRPAVLLSSMTHANLVALMARVLSGVKTRVVVREAVVPTFEYSKKGIVFYLLVRTLVRVLYRFADHIVAPSLSVASDLAKFAAVRIDEILVIYNPVDIDDIREKGRASVDLGWVSQERGGVIVAAGRLVPQKDYVTLIYAFAKVRKDINAKLLILGEGPELDRLSQLVRDLRIAEHVRFLGFVVNPFAYMARSDVFVLSSRWEGLPNVLIQALVLGRKVVATDAPGGSREILNNGIYGTLVPVADVESLACALVASLQDEKVTPCTDFGVGRFAKSEILGQYLSLLEGQWRSQR